MITIIQPVDKAAVIVFAHEGAVGDRHILFRIKRFQGPGLNTRCFIRQENWCGSIIVTMEDLRTLTPFSSKQYMLVLGTAVALPMDVENLSNLANLVLTYGSTLVIAEGLDILPIVAVALILVLLTARIVKRKRSVLKSFRARGTVNNKRSSGRLLKSQRSPVMKPCPSCAEQLPLSAIICRMCGYNFLAERPGRGQTLLPSPQAMTDEAPEQKLASAEL